MQGDNDKKLIHSKEEEMMNIDTTDGEEVNEEEKQQFSEKV